MDAPFHIRPAQTTDVPGIVAIERASFSDPWSPRDFEECATAGVPFLVAEAAEEILGHIIARHAADEGEILNLGVAVAWRRRGVGRALVAATLVLLRQRGVGNVFLEVRVSNEAAQHLYTGFGFTQVGRRRHYYRFPTEDAVILRAAI
jgi:ribosomal-protein-alanine N-acetyltransferase